VPLDVDAELDRLYGLPPDEFTAARNELVSTLRKEGRRDEAEEVKGLAKPTLAAWVVNQLARREAEGVRGLVELADRQREAVAGGDTAAMRAAAEEERRAVRELVGAARRLLREHGRGSDAVVEKVATTLRATAGDPDARGLLERGRLAREVEASGFGALAGMQPRAALPDPRADARERAKALRIELRELQQRARELDRQARDLEREAERAAKAATTARKAADEAQGAVERAEAALLDLSK